MLCGAVSKAKMTIFDRGRMFKTDIYMNVIGVGDKISDLNLNALGLGS